MDPETSSQTVMTGDNAERIKKISELIILIIFIGTIVGNTVTIALGGLMLQNCYIVALVVMILGSVLGFIQQIPEFFRNFVEIGQKTRRYMNYFYGVTIVLRISWLITATVVITKTQCDDVHSAWICVSINWVLLALFIIFAAIVTARRIFKGRRNS